MRKQKLVDDYILITQKPENPKEKIIKYWESYIQNNEEILKRTKCNISRKETMDLLNCSMIYASTSPNESAGITTFESFSMGVPALLWDVSERHASVMFSPNGRGIVWEYFSCKDQVKQFVEYAKTADRNLIREITFKENSKEKTFNELYEKLKEYISSSNIVTNVSLEEFF